MAVAVLDPWSFVDNDDPSARTVSVSAGSERALVLAYGSGSHDISAFGWSVTDHKIGDQSPVATFQAGDASDDAPRYISVFGETKIAAFTDSVIDWTATNIVNEFYGYGTYTGVDQSALTSLLSSEQSNSANASSMTFTTTSSTGDRIIVLAVLNAGTKNFSDWDTLSEQHDASSTSGDSRFGLAEGDGGDGSTVVTNTTFARPNGLSIVLPQSGGVTIPTLTQGYYRDPF